MFCCNCWIILISTYPSLCPPEAWHPICRPLHARLHIVESMLISYNTIPQSAATVSLKCRLFLSLMFCQSLIRSLLSCCWWQSMVVEEGSEWCAAPSLWYTVSLCHSCVWVPACPCCPRVVALLGWQQCWSRRTATGSCGSWGFCTCVRSALQTAVWAGYKDYSALAPYPQIPLEGCPWLSSRSVAAGCRRSCH